MKTWVAIIHAYGEFEVLGTFPRKRDAVFAVQIHDDTSQRPNKRGEIGNSLVCSLDHFNLHFRDIK